MLLQEKRNSKGLGVPGIPTAMEQFLDGAIYAAIVDSVPARFSLVVQSIRSNLEAGQVCVLLTPTPPAVFLARAEAAGVDFNDALVKNKFYLFSSEGDHAKNLFRLGPKRFLEEFSYFGVPKGSFFVIDQADDLFTLHDQNISVMQAQTYRDWMKQRNNTALFLFPPEQDNRYQLLLDYFSGAMRIVRNKAEFEMLVDFWYSKEGAIAAKVLPVAFDKAGFFRVEQRSAGGAVASEIPEDQNQAFYAGPDFEAFSAALPKEIVWTKAESLVNLLHITHNSVAAAVVIALDRNSDLRQVVETVHYLRMNRGDRIRILIREVDFCLRYPNELLFLKLGANLIIHRQIAQQRLALLWESLSGQVYTKKLGVDFEKAFESTVPSQHTGYIDLVTFCREGLAVLERSNFLAISPALIAAAYRPPHSPPEVLGRIKVSRKGDLISSDEMHCYIFLHSCPEANAAATFLRIVGGDRENFFSDVGYILEPDKIREALQLISVDASQNIDFGEAIAAAREAVPEEKMPEVKAPEAEPAAEPGSETPLKNVMKRLSSEQAEAQTKIAIIKSGN